MKMARMITMVACLTLGLVGLLSGTTVSLSAAEKLQFNRDIRPILSDRCFACHGPDEAANDSGFRLDRAEDALAELPSGEGYAIQPGNPANSLILERMLTDDPDLLMPPPETKMSVSKKEVEILRQWISQGAEYQAHWSFIPPVKPEIPESSPQWTAHNEIDHFIHARLKQTKLSPSDKAGKETIIRRLSLDLTGLPPTSAEVEQFVADRSPEAFQKLVDRLLSSPHFGERMALDWLDAARYADTNGFSIDGGRQMWLWRDWVIHAFNTNMPYDQFLRDQLAGDLHPEPTPAQLIATGFQRNNMVTHEGGTIPEENLTNYNVDRVRTLGEAVLGLTIACAQCHDHKYDPITQKDFYSLYAYFNTLSDVGLDGNGGVNPRPYLQAQTVLPDTEIPDLKAKIIRLEAELATVDVNQLAAWETDQKQLLEQRGNNLQLYPLPLTQVSTPNRADFDVIDNRYLIINQPGSLSAYDLLARLPESAEPITGLRVVFHPSEKTPGQGLGFGPTTRRTKPGEIPEDLIGNLILTAVSVSTGEVPADQVDLYRLRSFRHVSADAWRDGFRPENVLDLRNINGWSPPIKNEETAQLTVTFTEPIDPRQTPWMTTQLNFGYGDNYVAGKVELLALTGNDDDSPLPAAIIEILQVETATRSSQQQSELEAFYRQHAPQTARIRIDLANARERLQVLTEKFPVMVMNISDKPRQTFILNRGDYAQPTVPVSMGTPEFLPRHSAAEQNRIALVDWVTMPNHPLTARVYVNRVWQMFFGTGIVNTPADFGAQGAWPTHPELLDWLSVDFAEHGWDVKRLVRQIVNSATYQQSSATTAQLLEIDPHNELLARGPRFRLPAEFIRDSALKASGLLVTQIGGPSVNPYTPGDLWREISHYGSTPATAQTFVQDHGEKLYRRSLYTFWKRTAPPPNMAAFDAPNRETCVVNRPTTNTPLQALVLLNDVQFVEAARVMAERILQQPLHDQLRLTWAFREILSRDPSPQELTVLQNALQREKTRYAADHSAAFQLISAGESPRPHTQEVTELAAWTQLASLLFNLSESVTRQ